MTADRAKVTEFGSETKIEPGHPFAVQRGRWIWRSGLGGLAFRAWRSVTMWPHRVGNPALLQPVLRQPRVGGLDRARDVIGGPREIVG